MKFAADNFYHVFNRGNNRQLIFPQQRNYTFFLSKLKDILGEHCHIVAYCLMPNHFHLMLYLDELSTGTKTKSNSLMQALEQKLGTLQSSYTRAINNQENKTGSLFQNKIKIVELDTDHAFTCFHYIHQNPLKAKLVNKFDEWPYSSYVEYIDQEKGICNKGIAFEFLEICKDPQSFAKQSDNVVLDENIIAKIESSRPVTQSDQATKITPSKKQHIAITGAGLVGSLLSIYLAQRGHRVSVFERRPDMRKQAVGAGRSINLALSNRGLRALDEVGLTDEIKKAAIPMHGRMMHDRTGKLTFQPYGKEGQFINSISRSNLNIVLMDKAESLGVHFHFEQKITAVDFEKTQLEISRPSTQSGQPIPFDAIFGADGAYSAVRSSLQVTDRFNYSQDYIAHGYKELHIPATESGAFQLEKNALHIWPRESFMLIALPNPDGSFTCTLFFPFEGPFSFHSLKTENEIVTFLKETFPDVFDLMPNAVEAFMSTLPSSLVTVKCFPWTKNKTMLIGDAAHAIVPFYGQGMNAGFEDCRVLNQLLDHSSDWTTLFNEFQKLRKPDTDAIAKLALDNFIEMRDLVADVNFLLRKKIEATLNHLFPNKWIPLYSMVTFHDDIRYSDALAIGIKQKKIMDEVMQRVNIETTWEQLDFESIVSKL
jgi:kynurenine 3-monooxygenase